jgi:flagellar hook-associated protein 2
MPMSPVSSFRSNDPYEQLIQSMISVESQPKQEIIRQRQNQERFKAVLSDFDSKLSALRTAVRKFTDPLLPLFGARTATTTSDAFRVSAGSKSDQGSHELQVLRLARADSRVSSQFTGSQTSLADFFAGKEPQSFAVGVASPNKDDPDRRVSIAVTVNPQGTTDDEILKEISDAVDAAMRDAVSEGLIKQTERAGVSLVRETSTTARLSVRGAQTGFANRLTFNDSPDGLLAALGLNQPDGSDQVFAVGTTETDSLLNSQFVLNGLTIYRNSNQVRDVLSGVTIDLQKTTEAPESFSVALDRDAVRAEVDGFIKKYNELLSYIEAKSRVDGTSGTRGDFAGDSTFRDLRLHLRNDVSRPVEGQPAEGPGMLADLGITTEKDGTLKLGDADKLFDALEANPSAVQSLLSGDDGVARRIETRLDSFLGTTGIVSQRTKSIDERLKRYGAQIKQWDERMASRESQLRNQFAKFQETIAILQGQQTFLNSFLYAGYGFGQ